MDINLDTLVLSISAVDTAGALEDTIYLGDYSVVGEDVIGAPGLSLTVVLNPIATPLPINVSLGTIVLTLNLQVIYPYELGTGSEVCDMGTLLDYLRMGGRSLPASLAGSDDVTSWIDDMVSPNVGDNPATCLMTGVLGGGGEADSILVDGWQQSVVVYEDGILIAPMLYTEVDATSGISLVEYSFSDSNWSYINTVHNGAPTYATPNTARTCSTFSIYYGDWWQEDTFTETLRLHIFKDGAVTVKDFYDVSVTDYLTYTGCENFLADIHSSGLIACLAYLTGSGDHGTVVVHVSTDFGATWKSPHLFPDIPWYAGFGISVRIDNTGVIWVAFSDNLNDVIDVYKSTNSGDSWSKVGSVSHLGATVFYTFVYTVDYTGQYQYISFYANVSGNYRAMYKSSDYGVTWVFVTELALSPVFDSIYHTSNQQFVVYPRYTVGAELFRRSTDSGANFSDVEPPVQITDSYVDMQSYREKIVYTECGGAFGGDSLGALYSLDNGATWQVLNIDTIYGASGNPDAEDVDISDAADTITEPAAGDDCLMKWALYDIVNGIKGVFH